LLRFARNDAKLKSSRRLSATKHKARESVDVREINEEHMTRTIAVAIVLALVAPSLASAKSTKHRKKVVQAQPQIACTVLGCAPVRPGCGHTTGRTWSGAPSGYDVVVCPPGVNPFQ
jgi:hypothetical protein